MKIGPCAKTQTKCTIYTKDGAEYVGTNYCHNPQKVCPRKPSDGYDKCKTICHQEGHAEQVAVDVAGKQAVGATAYLEGHTYYCMDCQHALFSAGVVSLRLGKP